MGGDGPEAGGDDRLTLTENRLGLVIEPWRDLRWFLDKARQLGAAETAWPFLCGDLMAEADRRFGEEWSQLEAAFGLDEETLRARLVVAQTFAPEVRDPRLTWSHYHAAVALGRESVPLALELLDWCKLPAADRPRPRSELRRALQGLRSGRFALSGGALVDTEAEGGPRAVAHLDDSYERAAPLRRPDPAPREPVPPPVSVSDTVSAERGTALARLGSGPAARVVPQDAVDEWADWGLRLAEAVCGSPDAGLALDPASLDRLAELLAALDPRRAGPGSRDAGSYWARPGDADTSWLREK